MGTSEQITFESGAKRSNDTYGCRLDLIPPEGLFAVGRAMHEGAEHYGADNFKKGMPYSVMINHCLQHITNFMMNDNSEDHLGHALANLNMLIWMKENKPEYDDRYKEPLNQDGFNQAKDY